MYETNEEIAELQEILDRSYASGGEHLLSIHAKQNRGTAELICEQMQAMCLLTLATAGTSGRPITSPVDGMFLHGRLWFGSSPESVRFKHIRKRPAVSATHLKGEKFCLVVHGDAQVADVKSGKYDYVKDACIEIYGKAWESWGHWENASYAWIEPQKMFSFHMG